MSTTAPALPNSTVYYLIATATARRRGLIHGRLDGPNDSHCAMGALWADNPKVVVNSSVTDEVAAVNDALGPQATPHQRWLHVRRWIRWKLRVLAGVQTPMPVAPPVHPQK